MAIDRKSTRLNSSHRCISYAVFCLKKKKKKGADLVSGPTTFDSLALWPLVSAVDVAKLLDAAGIICVALAPYAISICFFFFKDPATPEIYPLPLPAPLPI